MKDYSMDDSNVKDFLGRLISTEAFKVETEADTRIYLNLLTSDPEGKQYLSKEETVRFEKRLGMK